MTSGLQTLEQLLAQGGVRVSLTTRKYGMPLKDTQVIVFSEQPVERTLSKVLQLYDLSLVELGGTRRVVQSSAAERYEKAAYELFLRLCVMDVERVLTQKRLPGDSRLDGLIEYNAFYRMREPSCSLQKLALTLSQGQLRALVEEGRLTLLPKELTPAQKELIESSISQGSLVYRDREAPLPEEEAQKVRSQQRAFLQEEGYTLVAGRDPLEKIATLGGRQYPNWVPFYAGLDTTIQGWPVKDEENPYACTEILARPSREPVPPLAPTWLERLIPSQATRDLATQRLTEWSELLGQIWKDWQSSDRKSSEVELYSDFYNGLRVGQLKSRGTDVRLLMSNRQSLSRLKVTAVQGKALQTARNYREFLGIVAELYGKTWWAEGQAIFFRSKFWFVEARYHFSEAALQGLRRYYRSGGWDFYSVLSALTQLTPEQLTAYNTQMIAASGRGAVKMAVYGGGDQLHLKLLLQLLNPSQLTALFHGDSVTLPKLSPSKVAEWDRLFRQLDGWAPTSYETIRCLYPPVVQNGKGRAFLNLRLLIGNRHEVLPLMLPE